MTKKNLVLFRGEMVRPNLPEALRRAQEHPRIRIRRPDGTGEVERDRIRYGQEEPSWPGEICHDCCAIRGEVHDAGCDVERCPLCFGQAISCGCLWDDEQPEPEEQVS